MYLEGGEAIRVASRFMPVTVSGDTPGEFSASKHYEPGPLVNAMRWILTCSRSLRSEPNTINRWRQQWIWNWH
jgi:hypothetical protein